MKRGQMLRFGSQAELDAHLHGVVPPRVSDAEKLRASRPERDILQDVLDALRKHPLVAWAHRQNTAAGFLIPTDVYKRLVAAGHLQAKQARFIRFGWKGQCDITGQLHDGRRLDVECKRAGEKPTEEQQATIDAVHVAKGVAFVARDPADVFRWIAAATERSAAATADVKPF